MPKLPFIDYQVENPLSSDINLNNDQVSPATLFSYPWTGSASVIIEYSIMRSSSAEVGRILITTDGVSLSFAVDKANQADTGVTLSGSLNGSNVDVKYTSTNTGQTGVFRYTQRALS